MTSLQSERTEELLFFMTQFPQLRQFSWESAGPWNQQKEEQEEEGREKGEAGGF